VGRDFPAVPVTPSIAGCIPKHVCFPITMREWRAFLFPDVRLRDESRPATARDAAAVTGRSFNNTRGRRAWFGSVSDAIAVARLPGFPVTRSPVGRVWPGNRVTG